MSTFIAYLMSLILSLFPNHINDQHHGKHHKHGNYHEKTEVVTDDLLLP